MGGDPKSPVVPALRRLVGAAMSVFGRRFNSSKCKTEAKMAAARIKLLRNKREVQVRQMRRDIAALLESGRDDTARIRVEHVIREQNTMAANEIIEVFCELVVVRLPIIAKRRECPADLREAIASLIYAAQRCSEIPELGRIVDIFEKKYGKDFVSAASDLRPNSGVNSQLIEKLSVRKPTGEVKLKILKEIAKQYQVKWDMRETELELLAPPEERLKGPSSFVSATSLPAKTDLTLHDIQLEKTEVGDEEHTSLQFKDSASAARAAAEFAEKAACAAQAAAYLGKHNSRPYDQKAGIETSQNDFANRNEIDLMLRRQSLNSSAPSLTKEDCSANELKHQVKIFSTQSFNESRYVEHDDTDTVDFESIKIPRRNSCIMGTKHSDIQFDDSDGFESGSGGGVEMDSGSVDAARYHFEDNLDALKRNAASHVHPKLPDYETLAARFEALKSHRT